MALPFALRALPSRKTYGNALKTPWDVKRPPAPPPPTSLIWRRRKGILLDGYTLLVTSQEGTENVYLPELRLGSTRAEVGTTTRRLPPVLAVPEKSGE